MDGPNPKHTTPDDGGLGQVLGALEAEKQTKELEAQARKREEAIERNARIKAVEEAFVHQDAVILNAVATFLQKASHITPAQRVVTRYETRRRFVPFVIERYTEAVEWEGAHVIFEYHRSLGEDASVSQTVLVRTDGIVIFWSNRSRLGQKVDDSRQKTERPTDQPGVLPFWIPKPNPDNVVPLRDIPDYHDELSKLSKEDVDRTIEWFVHALAAYLVHRST
jgi:hypothetical protein